MMLAGSGEVIVIILTLAAFIKMAALEFNSEAATFVRGYKQCAIRTLRWAAGHAVTLRISHTIRFVDIALG